MGTKWGTRGNTRREHTGRYRPCWSTRARARGGEQARERKGRAPRCADSERGSVHRQNCYSWIPSSSSSRTTRYKYPPAFPPLHPMFLLSRPDSLFTAFYLEAFGSLWPILAAFRFRRRGLLAFVRYGV